MFGTLMSWEARDFEVAKNREDAARIADKRQVEATFSWIEATDRLLRKRGVPLVVFLVPVGSVDPDYADFWKPWPRTYVGTTFATNGIRSLPRAFPRRARATSIAREPGQRIGTYRKLDGHWSQKGEAIVADRIKAELAAFRSGSPLTKAQ